MPTYAYEAVTGTGAKKKGTVEATSSDDAEAKLRADGLYPTSVKEQKGKGKKQEEAAAPKKKK